MLCLQRAQKIQRRSETTGIHIVVVMVLCVAAGCAIVRSLLLLLTWCGALFVCVEGTHSETVVRAFDTRCLLARSPYPPSPGSPKLSQLLSLLRSLVLSLCLYLFLHMFRTLVSPLFFTSPTPQSSHTCLQRRVHPSAPYLLS